MPKSEDRKELTDGLPDVQAILEDFDYAYNHRDANYWSRQDRNYNARRCLWSGKTADGRKHDVGTKEAFPWDNASDIEVPLVDKYIREDVAFLMSIWSSNRVMVKPTQPSRDAGWSNRATGFLRWLIYEGVEDGEDEAELAANIYLERGHVAISPVWERVETLVYEKVTMRQIQQAAEVAQQKIDKAMALRMPVPQMLQTQAMLPQLIADPTQADVLVAVFGELIQGDDSRNLDQAQIRRVLADLRTNGEARFPKVDVLRDHPTFTALVLNEDVFLPPEATNVQDASAFYRREMLTETQMVERERTWEWDPEWIEEVIETQRGNSSKGLGNRPGGTRTGSRDAWGKRDRLFEIVHSYQRRYDKNGVPGIWYTCLSPGVDDRVASHALLDYDHGLYPLVVLQLERKSRSMDDSRGYGERGEMFQRAVKTEWDSRVDRASITTLPPSFHPPGEAPDEWGPGTRIPTRRPEGHGFMRTPPPDSGSREVEAAIRQFSDECFGRVTASGNQMEAGLLRQELARGWMRGWKRVYRQVFALAQQYCPDEIFYRVVGSDQGRLIRATRDEIQGAFNIVISFNVRDQDPEFVTSKLDLIGKALSYDTGGQIDKDELLKALFELIDPGYGERLLMPSEHAALGEVDDEKRTLSQLLLGIPVDVKPGQAFGMRLATLQSLIQKSPTVQKLIQMNPQARLMVETRIKQMQHQLDQAKNADTGKFLGTAPMADEMAKQIGAGDGGAQ